MNETMEGINDDVLAIAQQSLPKSRTRTSAVTNRYNPRGRLFAKYLEDTPPADWAPHTPLGVSLRSLNQS